jgi:hypothetical protein
MEPVNVYLFRNTISKSSSSRRRNDKKLIPFTFVVLSPYLLTFLGAQEAICYMGSINVYKYGL